MAKGAVGRLLAEVGEEAALQEPVQAIIEQAAKRSIDEGVDFLPALMEAAKQYPEILKEVGPESAASTLLTQMLFMGLGAVGSGQRGAHRVHGRAADMLTREDTVEQDLDTRVGAHAGAAADAVEGSAEATLGAAKAQDAEVETARERAKPMFVPRAALVEWAGESEENKARLEAILGRPLTEDAAPGEASAPEYEEVRMTQDEYARIVEEAPDLAERVRDDVRKGTDGRTNNEIRRMLERQTRKDPLWNEQETKDIQARIEQEMAAAGRPEAEAKDLARMAMAFAIATHRRVGGAIPLARIVDVHILGRGTQGAEEAAPVGGAGQETASAPGDMARAQRAEAEIYAQNEDGTWHLSFSSDRYSLASGGSLESAASGDHILKDGGIAWGRVTEELSDGRADVPVGDIRVPVGNEKAGLVHAKGHEGQFAAKGFADAEGFIEHTLGSFNTIVPVGDGKHFIAYDQGLDTSPAAVLAWRQDGGYYDLLTAYPAKRKTMNRIKKKSSSLRGAASSAQAPALAPSLASAAAQSPESSAAVPYGNDDADIIAAIEGDVNRGGSVQTAEETAREMGYGQDEGLLQLAVAALGKVKDKVESYAQNMWHGSRHILEGMKFLLEKIGTGEGAQAYGWGVYLAQLRRVSETYMMAGAHGEDRTKSAIGRTRSYEIWRDRDSGSWRTHGGVFADEYRYPGLRAVLDAIVDDPSPALSPMQRMAQFIEEKETELAEVEAKKAEQWAVYDALFKARSEEMTGQEQEALEEAYLAYCDAVTRLEVVARTLDLAKEIEPDSLKHLSYGNLYRVEGPEDDVLLDYDAPMAEQNDAVKAIYEELWGKDVRKKEKAIEKDAKALIDGMRELAPSVAPELDQWVREAIDGDDSALTAHREDILKAIMIALTGKSELIYIPNPDQTRDVLKRRTDFELAVDRLARRKSALRYDTRTGQQLYKELSLELGGDKEASLWLKERGIPGLMYWDGFSRKKGEGSRNFVIWDVDLLEVMDVAEGPAKAAFDAMRAETEGYEQRAWSGSPNVFQAFDLSYVNSGEGTQEEGYGLYSSQRRGVGEWYRDKESAHHGINDAVKVDGYLYEYANGEWGLRDVDEEGEFYSTNNVMARFLTIFTNEGEEPAFAFAERVVEEWEKYENDDDYEGDPYVEEDDLWLDDEGYAEAADLLKNRVTGERAEVERVGTGALYEVEIPESEDLLHRDAELKDQSEKVQKAIQAIAEELGFEYDEKMTGTDVQEAIAEALGVDYQEIELGAEDVSMKLLEHGIPGVEYSRGGDGDGYSNFVIWDDSRIDIVERYQQTRQEQDTAEQKLAQDEAAWGREVDRIMADMKGANAIPYRDQVDVMDTPTVLTLLGAKRNPIRIEAGKLKKILREHPGMSDTLFKQLPRAMVDPIAVFKSDSPAGGLVVMTDLKDADGATVIATLHLDERANVTGADIHKLASAYGKERRGKPNDQWFLAQAKKGNLLYVDGKKSSQWAYMAGHSLPPEMTPAGNSHIVLTEADLVNARAGASYYQAPDDGATEARVPGSGQQRGRVGDEEVVRGRTSWGRGKMAWEGRSLIELFKHADASTAFHELAHHMFRVLVDVASLDGAPADIVADVETVLRHAGVTREQYARDARARRRAHEYFAQGFETYLSEGKAPTAELKSAFERIRQWMIQVYNDVVAALGIELTPEMREVYDRLLATPAEIDARTTVGALATEDAALRERMREEAARERGQWERDEGARRPEDVAREMGYGADGDLFQLALAALGKVKDTIESYAQKVWHGSQHVLEGMKFMLEKIGTGEGNQAYGWGIYLAMQRAVSKGYMKAGAGRNKAATVTKLELTNGGTLIYHPGVGEWGYMHEGDHSHIKTVGDLDEAFDNDEIETLPEGFSDILNDALVRGLGSDPASELKAGIAELEEALDKYVEDAAKLREALDHDGSPLGMTRDEAKKKLDVLGYSIARMQGDLAFVRETVDALDLSSLKLPLTLADEGNLYLVEAPENDELLDWDAPIEEQIDAVKKALEEADRDVFGGIIQRRKEYEARIEALLKMDKAFHEKVDRHTLLGDLERAHRVHKEFVYVLDDAKFALLDGGTPAKALDGAGWEKKIASKGRYPYDAITEWLSRFGWSGAELESKRADILKELRKEAMRLVKEKAAVSKLGDSFEEGPLRIRTGEEFYRALGEQLTGISDEEYWADRKKQSAADKAASLWLKDRGIPGLRYWDGFSRAKAEGTHNLVIWDVDLLKVLDVAEGPAKDVFDAMREGETEGYEQSGGKRGEMDALLRDDPETWGEGPRRDEASEILDELDELEQSEASGYIDPALWMEGERKDEAQDIEDQMREIDAADLSDMDAWAEGPRRDEAVALRALLGSDGMLRHRMGELPQWAREDERVRELRAELEAVNAESLEAEGEELEALDEALGEWGEALDEAIHALLAGRFEELMDEEQKDLDDEHGRLMARLKVLKAEERAAAKARAEELEERFEELADEEEGIGESYGQDAAQRLAPNGKPSNLDGELYAAVRTDAFKAFFGDWEMAQHKFNIVEAEPALFNSVEGGIQWAQKNGIIGDMEPSETNGKGKIKISVSSVRKMLHSSQREKSVSPKAHFAALTKLRDIIRESELADRHPDYLKGEDEKRAPENGINPGVTIDVIYGALRFNGETYRVKTTLKRYAQTDIETKAYAYEVSEIEVLPEISQPESRSDSAHNTSILGNRLLQGVKNSKGNLVLEDRSKVVDANGEPLVVWHSGTFGARHGETVARGPMHFGTREAAMQRIGAKAIDDAIQSIETWEEDDGTWSASVEGDVVAEGLSSEEEAYDEAVSIARTTEIHDFDEADEPEAVFLNIRNPKRTMDAVNDWDAVIEAAKKEGYDGIVYRNAFEDVGSDSYIAFYPEQIKSATDNRGTFDTGDADIYHQTYSEDEAAAMGLGEEMPAEEGGLIEGEAPDTEAAYREGEAAGRAEAEAEWRERMLDLEVKRRLQVGSERAEGQHRLNETRTKMRRQKWERVKGVARAARARLDELEVKRRLQVGSERARGQMRVDALRARLRHIADVKREVGRLVGGIGRMARSEGIIWAKQQEIRELLEGYDLMRRTDATLEKRREIESWLREDPALADALAPEDLEYLDTMTLGEMTMDDLRGLYERVRELYEEGRREHQMWTAERQERRDRLHKDLRDSLAKTKAKTAKIRTSREDMGKQYKGVKGKLEKARDHVHAAFMSRDRFFDFLDRGKAKYRGAFVQTFVDRMSAAHGEALRHATERHKWVTEELRDLGFKMRDFSRKATEIDGKVWTWSMIQELYLGMRNEDKANAIIWGCFVNTGAYTPEQARSIVDRLIGMLSEDMKAAAELVAQDHDANFDRINEAMIAATVEREGRREPYARPYAARERTTICPS